MKKYFCACSLLLMLCMACMIICTGCADSTASVSEDNITPAPNGTDTPVSDIIPDAAPTTIPSVAPEIPTEAAASDDIERTDFVEVNFSGTTISSSDTSAVAISGATVTIKKGGTYVFSGILKDGQIIVDSSDEENVELVLNGVDITCKDCAPIYIVQVKNAIITLPDGSKNIITDGSSYTYINTEKEEPDAAIFSKDDLFIQGTGTLVVNANFNDGIASKDDLEITGGTLYITAVNHGLKGKDCVTAQFCDITISSGNEGIKSTNAEEEGKGYITIDSGTFNITCSGNAILSAAEITINSGEFNLVCDRDAVQATKDLNITGGDFNIVTAGGSGTGVAVKAGNGFDKQFGNLFGSNASDDSTSSKALKSDANIIVAGGNFVIDSADDAIHSNAEIYINGGNFMISSGDDGIHADSILEINDGSITIKKSYEGLEAAVLTINGGDISVTASDDGLNAAGGSDSSSMGRPGQNNFSSTSLASVIINDGTLYVNAGGDGLDSNGSLTVNGGTVIVDGPTDNGNGALDSNGSIAINGGYFIAAGSSGMAESFGSSSEQYSFLCTFNSQKAGTLIHIEDASGEELITYMPSKQFASVVFSSAEMSKGNTYSVYLGGVYNGGTEENGILIGGTYSGGTLSASMTLNSVSTSNKTGSNMGGGFGGGMGGAMGGRR